MIESVVRGHDVAATIAPFRRQRDGREALLALKSQHAGKAIYDQLVKEAENVLKNRLWSGTTSITLQQHMGLHRKAFITLSECAEQIPVDIPNERARVTYLLDSLTTTDPNVLAAMAAVHQDEVDKRVNFESLFTFLAPTCPVTAKVALGETARSLERERLVLLFATTSLLNSRTCPKTNKMNWSNGTGPMDAVKVTRVVGREEAKEEANEVPLAEAPVMTQLRS
jgi:hypothetical protein